ncbi:PSD1 and planctomycete cytochrome C domain-containing protein [Schlesneria paludicola]|uniref:PSD1 and planctomycete cytochrome C domain-containing protein n=1 Tax=Schlesneria paludicola TaxID=360056 RepID=UPI00029B3E41|nr:PSD1 and planctomycete cytochrome C domain-containing protein [Schlesneria paludicola]
MERFFRRSIQWLICLGLVACSSAKCAEPAAPAPTTTEFDASSLEFFEKEVRPILTARCLECHSSAGGGPKGGLQLDSRDGFLKGGDTGPAVSLTDPATSLFLSAINYGDLYQMPPKSRLPASEITTLTKWIEQGLPWPKESASSTSQVKPFDLAARAAEHWCWQPIQDAPPPSVKQHDWPKSTADQFILAKLEQSGLIPAPPAEKATLLRRVYFDLIGLPPSPTELDDFLNDNSPQAFERVVNRLLDSPHFGERWGRHWLDLARYAETRGHEFEPVIPNAWQYRDYVIRALNADVPYDRFLKEQVAGDLIEPRWRDSSHATATPINESLLGTAFWLLGEEVHSPVDIRKDETDRMDNRLDVLSKTFLGLTVACARCHDHKFDAISQRDYYALAGFAISSGYRLTRVDTAEQHRRVAVELDQTRQAARDQVAKSIFDRTHGVIEDGLNLYLTSAKQLIEQNSDPGAAIAENDPRLAAMATKHDLNKTLLGRWCTELELAGKETQHPLFSFMNPPSATPPEPPASTTEDATPAAGQEAQVPGLIVDFSDTETFLPIQDGVSFGLRPTSRGDLQVVPSADGTQLSVSTIGGWRRDPFWNKISLSQGTEVDIGTIGAWAPYGRMVRSPEFLLTKNKIWYLVRGSVRAYAAVNSHLIVMGPLHGSLLREFKHSDHDWHWVSHGLELYQGHRLHVEFSPGDDGPCTVAMIVQSETEPSLPKAGWSGLTAALQNVPNDQRASIIQRAFQQVAQRLTSKPSGATSSARAAQEQVELADWFVRHLHLFSPDDQSIRVDLADQESRLSKQVRWDSSLAPSILDGNGIDEHLLVRGNSITPRETIPRRFLEACGAGAKTGSDVATQVAQTPAEPLTGSGRVGLAEDMLGSPLAARVAVNRIWHHLFGRGIVPSVDNFGVLGLPPSHPELLDHLATRFVREGWSTKSMIRSLVLSRTYQMSSHPTPADAPDPNNELWHRMPIKRLQGEIIRDSLLAVSGQLDPKLFGPSVPIHLTDFMQGRGRPGASGPLNGDRRRSIYISVRRNFLSPMMLAFDTPSPFSTVGRRTVSNVPAQALILMNDPFVVEQAHAWAMSALVDANATDTQRIHQLYLTAFARKPSAVEVSDAIGFVNAQGVKTVESQREAWSHLCHVLFNVKEFVFIE